MLFKIDVEGALKNVDDNGFLSTLHEKEVDQEVVRCLDSHSSLLGTHGCYDLSLNPIEYLRTNNAVWESIIHHAIHAGHEVLNVIILFQNPFL